MGATEQLGREAGMIPQTPQDNIWATCAADQPESSPVISTSAADGNWTKPEAVDAPIDQTAPHQATHQSTHQSIHQSVYQSIHTEPLLALLNQANLPAALLDQINQQLAHLEEQMQAQSQMIEQLRQESLTDSLTGLPNRRAYEEKIQAEWSRAMRTSQPLALVSLDVDHFKRYNDIYGHAQGDFCLQAVAQILRQSVQRGGDLVCRVGGEEFMVVLPGATSHTAKALADKIRLSLNARALQHEQNEAGQIVTLSIGVAHTVPSPHQTPADLYRAVDRALYQAKQQGRNQISLAEVVPGASGADRCPSRAGMSPLAPQVDPDQMLNSISLVSSPTPHPASKGMTSIRATQTAIDRSRSAAAKARWCRLIKYLAC